MRHSGIDLINRLGAARTAELLERAEWGLLSPKSLSGGAAIAVALLPPVVAGLVLFRQPAAIAVAAAVVAAVAGHILAHLLRIRLRYPLVVPGLVGVALVGAGASYVWLAAVPVVAIALEILRSRFLPAAAVSTGLVAYALSFAVTLSAVATYTRPASRHASPEPIALWLKFFGGSSVPVDPVKLYVGNVAGPILATSLLAVVLSIAWLWYSDAARLPVLGGFLAGALFPCVVLNWNPVYQLDSGPMWFVAALVLADARMQRHSPVVAVLTGVAAGVAGVSLRSKGIAIEGVFFAVLGVQLVVALTEGAGWLLARRAVVTRRLPGIGSAVKRLRVGGAPRSSGAVQEK